MVHAVHALHLKQRVRSAKVQALLGSLVPRFHETGWIGRNLRTTKPGNWKRVKNASKYTPPNHSYIKMVSALHPEGLARIAATPRRPCLDSATDTWRDLYSSLFAFAWHPQESDRKTAIIKFFAIYNILSFGFHLRETYISATQRSNTCWSEDFCSLPFLALV